MSENLKEISQGGFAQIKNDFMIYAKPLILIPPTQKTRQAESIEHPVITESTAPTKGGFFHAPCTRVFLLKKGNYENAHKNNHL